MTVQETIKSSTSIIKNINPDIKVYLFGSRARGASQKYSDIDIAIENNGKLTTRNMSQIKEKIENIKSLFEVQVTNLDSSSNKFVSGVKAYAKEIF